MAVAQYKEWGWRDMEELLQCPICFELPIGPVPMCTQGHHICTVCRQKVLNCPLCKSNYLPVETRNYVVEELLANVAVLKNIMTFKNLLQSPLDKKETQKKDMKKSQSCHNVSINKNEKSQIPPPVQSRGEYPCLFCPGKLYPVSRMLVHLHYFHSDNLYEVPAEVQPSQINIDLRYRPGSSRVFAIQFKNLGVFFLNMECNLHGQVQIFLRMVASHADAQKYNYSLKILNEVPNYFGRAMSCREPLTQMNHKGYCLVLGPLFMRKLMRLKRDKVFTVCVTVSRSVDDVVFNTSQSAASLNSSSS